LHKSLAEFFASFKLAAELGCLSDPFLTTYREEEGRPCTLPYTKRAFPELAPTVGSTRIWDPSLAAVRELMGQMIGDGRLSNLVATLTDARNHRASGFAVTNIVTLLSDIDQLGIVDDLSGLDLRSSVLRTSSLQDCSLDGTIVDDASVWIDVPFEGIIDTPVR
jgi:hypothetical protein